MSQVRDISPHLHQPLHAPLFAKARSMCLKHGRRAAVQVLRHSVSFRRSSRLQDLWSRLHSFSRNVSIADQQPSVFVWMQGVRESAAGEASSITRGGSATTTSSGWRGGCGVLCGQHCRVLRGHSASVGRYDQVSFLHEARSLVCSKCPQRFGTSVRQKRAVL